jgi:hypothetical protein
MAPQPGDLLFYLFASSRHLVSKDAGPADEVGRSSGFASRGLFQFRLCFCFRGFKLQPLLLNLLEAAQQVDQGLEPGLNVVAHGAKKGRVTKRIKRCLPRPSTLPSIPRCVRGASVGQLARVAPPDPNQPLPPLAENLLTRIVSAFVYWSYPQLNNGSNRGPANEEPPFWPQSRRLRQGLSSWKDKTQPPPRGSSDLFFD